MGLPQPQRGHSWSYQCRCTDSSNWGDVGSLAGYMIVNPDGSSVTTKPVRLNSLTWKMMLLMPNSRQLRAFPRRNWERWRRHKYQNILKTMGAKGVVCNFILSHQWWKGQPAQLKPAKSIAGRVGICLLQDCPRYWRRIWSSKLDILCQEILTEAESSEAGEAKSLWELSRLCHHDEKTWRGQTVMFHKPYPPQGNPVAFILEG